MTYKLKTFIIRYTRTQKNVFFINLIDRITYSSSLLPSHDTNSWTKIKCANCVKTRFTEARKRDDISHIVHYFFSLLGPKTICSWFSW